MRYGQVTKILESQVKVRGQGQSDPKWYAPLCSTNQIGIPTSNNI